MKTPHPPRWLRARRRTARLAACAAVIGLGLSVPPGTAASAPTGANTPQAGLLWHRSGLPATLPLLVMTSPGHDYYLTLRNTKTGKEILAAYIVGGEFFQVLVPPGTFTLQFEQGTTWMGEDAAFGDGPDTRSFTLDAPLTFGTFGGSVRAGHKVDLRNLTNAGGAPEVTPRAICQTLSLEFGEARKGRFERRDDRVVDGRFQDRSYDPFEIEEPFSTFELDPLRLTPYYTLRDRICD